jgi:hypothetical protein
MGWSWDNEELKKLILGLGLGIVLPTLFQGQQITKRG